MNYEYIESLVKQTQENNKEAKAKLLKAFAPVIHGYVKKFYMPGYEREDLYNEGVKTLLHAINIYDQIKHRFVSYGINSIKNSLTKDLSEMEKEIINLIFIKGITIKEYSKLKQRVSKI